MRLQKLPKIGVGIVIISMLAGLAIAAAGSYKLAFRMKKGQRFNYKTTIKVDQSMEMMGREMTSAVEGATSLHVEIEEVGKGGDITFVYAVDSLRTHVKNDMMQMDSTFKDPEGLIGKRTRITINAAGKKVNSVIVDSVQLSAMMMQITGGRQTPFNLLELPENEVKTGDSWTVTRTDTVSQGGGKIMVTPTMTYTVGAEVDTLGYKCVRLPYQGKTTLKGEGMQMGAKLFFDGEGPTTGVAYFAPTEGLFVAMVSDSDLELTIAVTGQQNMTIPQSSSTKLSMALVK